MDFKEDEMTANEFQIGGQHYKTAYEHWDLVRHVNMSYLVGCATKYVIRHRKKNGLEDLRKAAHYLDKLIETHGDEHDAWRPPAGIMDTYLEKFSDVNQLTPDEYGFLYLLCTYELVDDLERARVLLQRIIADTVIGTPEDGGHHGKEQQETKLPHRRGATPTDSAREPMDTATRTSTSDKRH
jgi:Protein of unknwon function (DUF3310)